jgi:hypothetical protein
MLDEPRASKRHDYVVQQWPREPRDPIAVARCLGPESETIGVVIRDRMTCNEADR